jgi:hypothetical protein
MKSFLLSLLSEAYAIAQRPREALATLDAAWSFTEMTGESFWTAELQRLRGEMILRTGSQPLASACQEAETCFLHARQIAAAHGATALELRAAMSLNQLWRRRQATEAHRVLAEVYDRFTQGFDSPDLVRARRLLDDLVAT